MPSIAAGLLTVKDSTRSTKEFFIFKSGCRHV